MDRKVIKMTNEARWADGQTARNRLDDITYNPMRSQEDFVMRMMRENSQTVLIPDDMFYEFKPTESRSYSHLLTLDQLEIGRSYELVVTTLSGLYRYKTKKTFLVVGRYHDTPTVIVNKE